MPLYTDLPIYLIEHPKDLTLHIPSLQEAEELGIDCESDNYYSYQDRLCFIQISTKKALYVLDALKLSDLSALRPIFAKPEVPKYIHGSEYDIVSLKRDFRLKIRGLFDTMIASQILNQNQFGLGALVKNYFGVELDKSLTVSPWDQRPISPEMFDYLINDIRYLIPLGHLLFYHLNKRGYTELASEHFQSLERKNWEKKSFNPGDFIKIKGAKNLNIEQQKRFYTLYRLREKLAKNLNYATFRILSTRELFLLAIHAPETLKKIEKLKLSSLPLSYGEQILEALEEAKNLPKDWVPPPKTLDKSNTPTRLNGNKQQIFESLKQWRDVKGREYNLLPWMVSSNKTLSLIAKKPPRDLKQLAKIPDFRGFRLHTFGPELLFHLNHFKIPQPSPLP